MSLNYNSSDFVIELQLHSNPLLHWKYYKKIISEAKKISENSGKPYFLGLCQHPYDVSFYSNEGKFFIDLKKIVENNNGIFSSYDDVDNYHKSQQSI